MPSSVTTTFLFGALVLAVAGASLLAVSVILALAALNELFVTFGG